jgi:GMP synthase (glutamine-hydrolysing)
MELSFAWRMSGVLRVALLDLLVERAEFGHGGNVEILTPLVKRFSEVEVFLLTPQFQSDEVGKRALGSAHASPVMLAHEDVPTWDDDFPFVAEPSAPELELLGEVKLRRVALPTTDDLGMVAWLAANSVDAVICSGSRSNVSMWDSWMDTAASVMSASVALGLPTLGICFGHQLLCKALGGEVVRAESRTDSVVELALSEAGRRDVIFSQLENPICLFTHQDHVVQIPSSCVVLGAAPHNSLASVRIHDEMGVALPAWGLQFHPEAVKLGHISAEEAKAFKQEHDGAAILANFADVILSVNNNHS